MAGGCRGLPVFDLGNSRPGFVFDLDRNHDTMNENNTPLTISAAASFVLSCAGFESVYVYGFNKDRWTMTCDGLEYWLIEDELGIRIVPVI